MTRESADLTGVAAVLTGVTLDVTSVAAALGGDTAAVVEVGAARGGACSEVISPKVTRDVADRVDAGNRADGLVDSTGDASAAVSAGGAGEAAFLGVRRPRGDRALTTAADDDSGVSAASVVAAADADAAAVRVRVLVILIVDGGDAAAETMPAAATIESDGCCGRSAGNDGGADAGAGATADGAACGWGGAAVCDATAVVGRDWEARLGSARVEAAGGTNKVAAGAAADGSTGAVVAGATPGNGEDATAAAVAATTGTATTGTAASGAATTGGAAVASDDTVASGAAVIDDADFVDDVAAAAASRTARRSDVRARRLLSLRPALAGGLRPPSAVTAAGSRAAGTAGGVATAAFVGTSGTFV